MDHQREGCVKVSPLTPLDAIDDVKQEQIDLVLRVRNSKDKTQEQKWSGDVQRWFKIWEILFPQIPPPESPCKSPIFDLQLMITTNNCKSSTMI